MLMSNEKLWAVFPDEAIPLVPKIAEQTYDALGPVMEKLTLSSTKIAVPLELEQDQQEFLKRLCKFWTVGYVLASVYDRHYGYDSD
jgi:hypothetical protein